MEALFAVYGFAALVAAVVIARPGKNTPPRVDDGPRADPALRVALTTRQPGLNNQGQL
ncbi:hypothetical protein [Microbacterium sp. XT11]|uniref:hypothetical protein n=1 Tax=Microbacterium sp. XT11 TaxID=367477 RepID=UPI000A6509CD|nr:hypothetical protein [Microbacterium sp. XT11]